MFGVDFIQRVLEKVHLGKSVHELRLFKVEKCFELWNLSEVFTELRLFGLFLCRELVREHWNLLGECLVSDLGLLKLQWLLLELAGKFIWFLFELTGELDGLLLELTSELIRFLLELAGQLDGLLLHVLFLKLDLLMELKIFLMELEILLT